MTASSRGDALIPVNPVSFEGTMMGQVDAEQAVHEFLEKIILNGAMIIHQHYLKTQRIPYACRTLVHELIMNLTWNNFPKSEQILEVDGDEDLIMPKIDQWANGAMIVYPPDSCNIRTSVIQEREATVVKKPQHTKKIVIQEVEPMPTPKQDVTQRKSNVFPSSRFLPKKSSNRQGKSNDAATLTRIFEEAKRQVKNNSKELVTVDLDFNIIPIAAPKNLAASLIVPRVQSKKTSKGPEIQQQPIRKKRVPIKQATREPKRKQVPKLIEADNPTFEDYGSTPVTISDKFICAPGVTLREGETVKSKPVMKKTVGITKAQYQAYLEDIMKKSSEE